MANGFAYGRLRWLDGANGGLVAEIGASAGDVLTLGKRCGPFAVEAGVRVMLAEGCDRRLETCAGRFGNAMDFRASRICPGNDLLTRYPGA